MRPARTAALLLATAALALLPGRVPGEDLAAGDDLVARLDVCYDFGCRSHQTVYLFRSDWNRLRAALAASDTPRQERERIAAAVGLMERIVATMAPTGEDRGRNEGAGDSYHGQQDCIDESTNTTRYLRLFQREGLLRHHAVLERVRRAPLLVNQHWAAQIEERHSGRRFAVDSWLEDNGEPARVQALEAWRRE